MYFEPNGYLSEKGVVVARVVVSPVHQTVPVQLLNPTKESIKLKQGTVVGYVEGIDIDPPDLEVLNSETEKDTIEKFDFSHLKRRSTSNDEKVFTRE